LSQTTNYILDATVLVDYYAKDETTVELSNLRFWMDSIIGNPLVTIYINTVTLLEFSKFLYFGKTDVKNIKNIIRRMSNKYNIVVSDLTKFDLLVIIDNLSRIEKALDLHAGELSLLQFSNMINFIFVSSDINALKSFKKLQRINPRKSIDVIKIGEEYIE